MPDTRKSRILMWECGSLESTVCYGFISLNRSWNGDDVWNFIKPAPRNSLWGWLLLVASVRNPPFLIVFDRKQWLVLSRIPRSSRSYRFLNSYKRVHLLKSARNKLLLRIRIIFRIRQLRDWREQWPISDNLTVCRLWNQRDWTLR